MYICTAQTYIQYTGYTHIDSNINADDGSCAAEKEKQFYESLWIQQLAGQSKPENRGMAAMSDKDTEKKKTKFRY